MLFLCYLESLKGSDVVLAILNQQWLLYYAPINSGVTNFFSNEFTHSETLKFLCNPKPD
jgi:hypothetical protein